MFLWELSKLLPYYTAIPFGGKLKSRVGLFMGVYSMSAHASGESHSICRKSGKHHTPGNLSNLRYWQFGEKTADQTIDFLVFMSVWGREALSHLQGEMDGGGWVNGLDTRQRPPPPCSSKTILQIAYFPIF